MDMRYNDIFNKKSKIETYFPKKWCLKDRLGVDYDSVIKAVEETLAKSGYREEYRQYRDAYRRKEEEFKKLKIRSIIEHLELSDKTNIDKLLEKKKVCFNDLKKFENVEFAPALLDLTDNHPKLMYQAREDFNNLDYVVMDKIIRIHNNTKEHDLNFALEKYMINMDVNILYIDAMDIEDINKTIDAKILEIEKFISFSKNEEIITMINQIYKKHDEIKDLKSRLDSVSSKLNSISEIT